MNGFRLHQQDIVREKNKQRQSIEGEFLEGIEELFLDPIAYRNQDQSPTN